MSDLTKIKTLDVKRGKRVEKSDEYFTRFPNEYIQGNIKEKFGINRKFYITYILIDKYRSYEDYSWITVRKVLEFYGYKQTNRKLKAFREVIDVLKYMVDKNMIEVAQDLEGVGYDTGIEIRVVPENFDYPDRFGKITSSQLDTIMSADGGLNRENVLMVFLYINSYIGCGSDDEDGGNGTYSEGFWKSIENMAKDLGISKDTINQCLDYLTSTSGDGQPLLIKYVVGSIQPDKKKPPKNVPNIYVLNKRGYKCKIELALKKMREIYGVKQFYPIKNGNYRFSTEK